MGDTVLGQCVTLVGYAAIPKKLLAVPTPNEEDSGKFIKVTSDGNLEWADIEIPKLSTPDWNQNDESADDYIKNRPFGYTETTTQYVWGKELTGISLEYSAFYESANFWGSQSYKDLKTYKCIVACNGVSYTLYPVDDGTGNPTWMTPDEQVSVVGFRAMWDDVFNLILPAEYANTTVDLNIYWEEDVTIYHKVPNEYMPDDHINSLIDAKLEVIENGTY